MRVVMVIQQYLPFIGGAERQLALVAPQLVRSGVDVHIITRQHDKALPLHEVINGVPVHRVANTGPKPIASLLFSLRAQGIIRRIKPDVIHAHGLLSPVNTALISKLLFRMPVVVKVLTGGEFGYVVKLRAKVVGRLRLQMMRRWVNAFIVISQAIADELKTIDVPASRLQSIPNGVDIDRYQPLSGTDREDLKEKLGIKAANVVMFCGRLTEQKRLDTLLEAWPEVYKNHSDSRLLVVGTGELDNQLQSLATQGVEFMGLRSDVDSLLKCADLFVLPSAAEGLSNAILEAMASAVCVVTTNIGGTVELITHDKTGFLVETGDVKGFENVIIRLLSDSACRISIGENACHFVKDHYSLEAVVEQLKQLYERLATTQRS